MPDPSISEAEWQVMQVIWADHPIAASDVVEQLAGRTSWHPSTIKTLINRLVQKGVLTFKQEGKRHLYRPKVPRERCVREASRSFLDRVFGGAVAPAVVHMMEHADLSPEEIEELKEALRKKERGR